MILIPHDAAVRQIIGRHFHGHFVTSRETDAFGGGLAANMRQEAMPVGQFHPEQGLFQHFHYSTFNFNGTFSRHVRISGSAPVINTVCSK